MIGTGADRVGGRGSRFFPRPLTRSARDARDGLALVSPTMLTVVVIVLLPFVAVLGFAFMDVRLVDIPRLSLTEVDWTTENFRRVLSSGTFWSALRTTVAYASLTTVGVIVAGASVAIALRHPFPGRGPIRALLLVPYVLPVVAATTIWKTMLNSQYGVVNAFGRQVLGWDAPIGFLSTTSQDFLGIPVPVTLLTVIVFEIWKTAPLAFLFITARLHVMPHELEEAASIDGASITQRLRHVVLPQLRGVLLLLILLRFIWSFQNFNDIYLLTAGAGGTNVMAIKVYDELITRANIGTAAAYGLTMTAMLAVLLVLYVRMNRKEWTD